MASIDYSLPLAYPDFSLGPIVYVKRIKANLFYDHGVGRDGGRNTLYDSVGAAVSADLNLFTLPFPFDLGVRYTYRLKDDGYEIAPLFLGVSF